MEIKHKVAIILSGSPEMNREISKALTDHDATVILANTKSFQNTLQKTLEKYWHVDILVNIIENGIDDAVEKIDVERYKTLAAENISDILPPMQTMIPIMRNRSGGAIVNVALHASAEYVIRGLSLAARAECTKDDVIVSTLRPKTDHSEIGDPKKVAKKITSIVKNESAEAEI